MRISLLILVTGLLGIPQDADLKIVEDVDAQPLAAQAKRIIDALDYLGRPLPDKAKKAIREAAKEKDAKKAVRAIQETLDPYCLVGVNINPESRVKVKRGPAAADLVEGGWRQFLIKVHNQAGVTARLKLTSPNAKPVFKFIPEQRAARF